METTLTATTLAQRVANHYEDCLGCNGSWCNFTNELAMLNLLDQLEVEHYEFVAELMIENTEEFEDEDFDDMCDAIGLFLANKKVPAEFVCDNDLHQVQRDTNLHPEDVARLAIDAGVPDEEIAWYLEEAVFNQDPH